MITLSRTNFGSAFTPRIKTIEEIALQQNFFSYYADGSLDELLNDELVKENLTIVTVKSPSQYDIELVRNLLNHMDMRCQRVAFVGKYANEWRGL